MTTIERTAIHMAQALPRETDASESVLGPVGNFDIISMPRTKDDFQMLFGIGEETATELATIVQQFGNVDINPETRRKIRALLNKRINAIQRESREYQRIKTERLREVGRCKNNYEEITRWAGELPKPFHMERCGAPSMPDLRHAIRCMDATVIDIAITGEPKVHEMFFARAQMLVIEHDWAGAMAKADLDAEFRLPYDYVAFEMKIGGRPIVAEAMTNDDGEVTFCPNVKGPLGWLVPGFATWKNGRWMIGNTGKPVSGFEAFDVLALYIGDQLRACCIALDAEVATTTAVRAHHRSNQPRGQATALRSYHVVSLARRTRAIPLSEPESTGQHRRMHFRRGHWRHYESHKTWIKWMLVGDPDLGFVDKHYKL